MSSQTHILKTSPALVIFTGGIHGADQIALAALPLIGSVALGLGPSGISILVAIQGAAWLLASLPAGVAADRWRRDRLIRAAPLLAAILLAAAWIVGDRAAPLAAMVFVAECAVVLAVLTSFALLPALVPRAGLPTANARLELARALATLAAAPLAGFLAERGNAGLALAMAALAAGLAGLAARQLPPTQPVMPVMSAPRPPVAAAVLEGGRFVLAQPVLRAIACCAVLWNVSFFALTAMMVPLALGVLGMSPRGLGLSLAGYGLGLVAGALVAPRLVHRVQTATLLTFGPALSMLGACLLWPATWLRPLEAGLLLGLVQFCLGFGPMIWQVVQTSLRQAVTPAPLLGRVGAVMQVAIFGVRPIGALAAGLLAGWMGPAQAIWLPIGGFALALVVLLAMLPRQALREALDPQ